MPKENIKNTLMVSRIERGLSRKAVGRALGLASSTVGKYETGQRVPPLMAALGLEIIYRKPVAFLWPELYSSLRTRIRAQEGAGGGAAAPGEAADA